MARPKNPELADKTVRIDARVSPDTRKGLEDAAAASGVSLSREIEERLRTSFAKDGAMGDGARREIEFLLWALRLLIERVEGLTGAEWQADGFTRDAVADGVRWFVSSFGPAVDGSPPPPSFPTTVPFLDEAAREEVTWLDEVRREEAARLLDQGVGRHCAAVTIRTMTAPFPPGPIGAHLQDFYSDERLAARVLGGLLRAGPTEEKEGGNDN